MMVIGGWDGVIVFFLLRLLIFFKECIVTDIVVFYLCLFRGVLVRVVTSYFAG